MAHLDPDRLVLIALGEQSPSPAETEHLAHCDSCSADLTATSTVVRAGRDSDHVRELPAPPADLWARIEEEAFRPAAVKRRPRWRLAVAAAAAVVLGIAGTVGVQWIRRHDTQRVIAEADLTPQSAAPPNAHGTAEIIDTGHGLQMRVDLSGMPATTGYYTVWLFDGGNIMIPIGSPGSAPLNLPPSADDLTEFRIVDVSAQSLGQQEHGVSMLQGHLGS